MSLEEIKALVKLKYYAWIDCKHISAAELRIKNYFVSTKTKFEHKIYSELAILTKAELNDVSKKFQELSETFGLMLTNIVAKYEHDKQILKTKVALLKKENEKLIEREKSSVEQEKSKWQQKLFDEKEKLYERMLELEKRNK